MDRKERKKKIIWVIGFICSIKVPTSAYQCVRFEESGLQPLNRDLLLDDFPSTCTAFVTDNEKMPRHTKFRTKVADYITGNVTVTLIGSNLGCDHNLYVTPLSAAETEKWTGRWTRCPLRETSMFQGKERCSYECQCSGSCEEIQVIKRPRVAKDSSWSVCHVCITTDYPALNGCTEATKGTSGIYPINITLNSCNSTCRREVYCDMETDGGGWTVILRRQDGSLDFYKEWNDYKFGFGCLDGEFWAGNELVHQLTNDGRDYRLKVVLTDFQGQSYFTEHESFSLGPESDNYRLYLSGFVNNSTEGCGFLHHNGSEFSTRNKDNDNDENTNFAKLSQAPWWYARSTSAVLTAPYVHSFFGNEEIGIRWICDQYNVLAKYAAMLIRPK